MLGVHLFCRFAGPEGLCRSEKTSWRQTRPGSLPCLSPRSPPHSCGTSLSAALEEHARCGRRHCGYNSMRSHAEPGIGAVLEIATSPRKALKALIHIHDSFQSNQDAGSIGFIHNSFLSIPTPLSLQRKTLRVLASLARKEAAEHFRARTCFL